MNTTSAQGAVSDFYSRIAGEYDAAMSAPDNERIRRCFWRLAAMQLAPGARLLDFGCGTGIDAQHFAAAGHAVVAYDVSPGMLRVLHERCRSEIRHGLVNAVEGTLEDLSESLRSGPVLDGVICNFAVLNLIKDPKPIFRLFGQFVRPGGKVILSLQNPWYLGDLRTRAFWMALPSLLRTGAIVYPSLETRNTYKHLSGTIVRATTPEFRRVAMNRRLLGADCTAASVGRLGMFRLLVFERT